MDPTDEKSMWFKCDLDSRLKLPPDELSYHTQKLLCLLECTTNLDVSLYILSLCFFHRKQLAFNFYEKEKTVAFTLLTKLEDRFINGVVSYRIGYIYSTSSSDSDFPLSNAEMSVQFFRTAFRTLKQQVVTTLSGLELFYIGAIYKDGKGIPQNNEKALKYYELSCNKKFGKALVNIGCMYRDGDGVTLSYEKAVSYYEIATEIKYVPGICHLAYMLEFGFGIKKDTERAYKLYQISAACGENYSIDRCKILGLTYVETKLVDEFMGKL
jgi:TPR repeat protein